MNKKIRWDWIAVFIIGILIGGMFGYTAGYAKGAADTLTWGIDKAKYFLKLQGVEVAIDTDLLAHAIRQYKDNIEECYPGYNDTIKK